MIFEFCVFLTILGNFAASLRRLIAERNRGNWISFAIAVALLCFGIYMMLDILL